MITTANMIELLQLLNSSLGDPHHILGMHEVRVNNIPALSVRVFIPQAKTVTVIDSSDTAISYEASKIHADGFFEAIIYDRNKWFHYKLKITSLDGHTWESYDPYSFPPILSDMDFHLFGEGTHYELFNRLGSHFMTINGINGVLFCCWAPNAKRVSVIGSFNNWDGRRHQMRLRERSGIWELFIPGLSQLDKYKYEIKTTTDQLLEKSDPYGNYFELRPSTSTLIYDINQYEWNDEQYINNRKENFSLDTPINIYEVHLGSWMRNPENNSFLDYRELADKLIPYVKEMNYNYIELMPVEEYPYDASWGYQVTGYYAPTSRYGTPTDFMYFIDKCHQNNISVLLDWVPAHFPKDAHGLANFDGSHLYEHENPRQREHLDWGTYIFNYGRKEVKNFLIANAIFWLEKYHIDGLRVDAVASMLYLDYGKASGQWVPNEYGGNENYPAVEFIKHLNSIIFKLYPHTLMIAEESTTWPNVTRIPEENGLGFNLKWNMGWMNDFLRYVSQDFQNRKYYHNNLTFSMMYAYTENFVQVLSHDEVVHGKGSLITKMPGDLWEKCANLKVALGFMYGHPGKKLLFMGGEFGQFSEWCEYKSLDWFLLEFEHHKQIKRFVQDLNYFYLNQEALWLNDFDMSGFHWISCDNSDSNVISFYRIGKDTKDINIFICNFSTESYTNYYLGVPIETNYQEVLNSDSKIYGGSGITNTCTLTLNNMPYNKFTNSISIKLPPLAVVVLKPLY